MISNEQHIGLELLEQERVQLCEVDSQAIPIYDLGLHVVSLYNRFTRKPLQEPELISAIITEYTNRHPHPLKGIGRPIQELTALIQDPVYKELEHVATLAEKNRVVSSEVSIQNGKIVSQVLDGDELIERIRQNPLEFVSPQRIIAKGYGMQLHLLKKTIRESSLSLPVGFFDSALDNYVTLYEVLGQDPTFPHAIVNAFTKEEQYQKSTSCELKQPR